MFRIATYILLMFALVLPQVVASPFALGATNFDLSGDGCVDQADLAFVKNAFNTDLEEVDFQVDGAINAKDVAKLVRAWSGACTPSIESPFGIEYGRGYRVVPFAPTATTAYWKSTGADWVKMNDVYWETYEPNAPVGGVHTYNWSALDHDISQETGLYYLDRPNWDKDFNIVMVLRSLSPWAQKPYTEPPTLGRPGRPPKDENLQDYRNWIKTLVERYDDDGVNDAPDLTSRVYGYEIESEGGFLPNNLFWYGTAEEYVLQLKTAYEAAREADPNVKIILNGINLRDFFAHGETTAQVMARLQSLNYPDTVFGSAALVEEGLNWIRDVLRDGAPYYDIIENHELDTWRQMPGNVNWIEEQLTAVGLNPNSKEIWAGDAMSAPQIQYISGLELNPAFGRSLSVEGVPDNALSKNLHLLNIMGQNTAIYNDIAPTITNKASARYTEYDAWFRKLQAESVVKKHVVGLAAGYNVIMMGNLENWPSFSGFQEQGFTDPNTNVLYNGNPRPMFYSYQLMTRMMRGVTQVARLDVGNPQVYFYEVTKSGGAKVYIAWMDNGVNEIPTQSQPVPSYPSLAANLPIPSQSVKVTPIITARNVRVPSSETKSVTSGNLAITLTKTPVFIELQ